MVGLVHDLVALGEHHQQVCAEVLGLLLELADLGTLGLCGREAALRAVRALGLSNNELGNERISALNAWERLEHLIEMVHLSPSTDVRQVRQRTV